MYIRAHVHVNLLSDAVQACMHACMVYAHTSKVKSLCIKKWSRLCSVLVRQRKGEREREKRRNRESNRERERDFPPNVIKNIRGICYSLKRTIKKQTIISKDRMRPPKSGSTGFLMSVVGDILQCKVSIRDNICTSGKENWR